MAKPRKASAETAAPLPGTSDEFAPELARLRGGIDAVDREILARLNDRAELVRRVGDLKRSQQAPVYVGSRERDLIAALRNANDGPFPAEGIDHVFREIISATRSLEETVRVGFLGPEGTFTHQAAVRQFGALVELSPAASIRDVFDQTERGDVHYGVVPVENTIEGAVTESFDCLVSSDVTICGELLLEITECLLCQSGDRSSIRRVASHPQGLAQCRAWLQRNLPDAELLETASTATAAQLAAREDDVGAIGSEVAAQAYGLRVVDRGIEDARGNTTRFVVIGRESPSPSGDDLTSAVFTVRRDQSGTLYRLLEPFARYDVNLSSIGSRPIKGKPWEYLFFIDVEGHASEDAISKALDEAAAVAHSHKLLGSFPRAPRTGGPSRTASPSGGARRG
ncbi:MAG: prephenate dehydratase [Proteobacteria bacterium]|nr:prephenate dehydratase [Pseudomonadota bacterium]